MLKNGLKEKDIESYLVAEVKKLKGKSYKWVSPGTVGVPDRLVFLPGGISFIIELKRPGEKTRPNQDRQISILKGLGQIVDVLDTKEKIDKYLDKYRKE